MLNDAEKYWDVLNHNPSGTTDLEHQDYSDTIKEINAWGDPVSKIGGFEIGKEYDLRQGQSLLGNILLDNPLVDIAGAVVGVGSVIGAKIFHSMDNMEQILDGKAQTLIDESHTKNWDGHTTIDNSLLNLDIRTCKSSPIRFDLIHKKVKPFPQAFYY